MNFYDWVLLDPKHGPDEMFWITDPYTMEGGPVSPMVYEWRKAMLDLKIWYLGLRLALRSVFY